MRFAENDIISLIRSNSFTFYQLKRTKMHCLSALLLVTLPWGTYCVPVEEYSVRGPGELHAAALDTYIKEREKDPANKEGGSKTPVMRRAREHAVKRFAAVPEDSLQMQVVAEFYIMPYLSDMSLPLRELKALEQMEKRIY